jgi:biopolymer transport protein ExbB
MNDRRARSLILRTARPNWTFRLAGLAVVAFISATALAQDQSGAPPASPAGDSFASAFFVSRVTHANGERTLDIIGSMLLWLLLLLSMLSIGLIGMMALTNQRKAYAPEGVVSQVRKLMETGRYREAINLTGADESFFCRVLNAALREAGHGFSAVIRAVEQTSDELTTQRLRRIEYLNILAQVSPMIGLFGTVWGMILAFRAIVTAGGNADPVLLARGIGTALTTTFWGLLIAIPALSAYAVIRNRIDQYTTEATRLAEELVNEFRPKLTSTSTTAPVATHAAPTRPPEARPVVAPKS